MTSGGKRYPAKAEAGVGRGPRWQRDLIARVSLMRRRDEQRNSAAPRAGGAGPRSRGPCRTRPCGEERGAQAIVGVLQGRRTPWAADCPKHSAHRQRSSVLMIGFLYPTPVPGRGPDRGPEVAAMLVALGTFRPIIGMAWTRSRSR